MVFSFRTFICEDFEFQPASGRLVIEKVKAVFETNDSALIRHLMNNTTFSAIVCPQLFADENGVKVKEVVFI